MFFFMKKKTIKIKQHSPFLFITSKQNKIIAKIFLHEDLHTYENAYAWCKFFFYCKVPNNIFVICYILPHT